MIIPATTSQIHAMRLNAIDQSRKTVPKLIEKLGEKEGGEVRISYDQPGKDRVHFDINLGYKNVSKLVTDLLAGLPNISDTELTEVHWLLTHSPTPDQQQIRTHIIYRLAEIFGNKSN